MISNLEEIKAVGIEQFIEKQKTRIDILKDLLSNYDDGQAKSFFCKTCTLLPIRKLQEMQSELKNGIANVELKEKSKLARRFIAEMADLLGINLKLNKKR
jgi:hypothetical protein